MKGLRQVWKPGATVIVVIGAAAFALAYGLVKPIVMRASATLENTRKSVSGLFTIPLVCSAALLSFGHGANDVANAVGPLAAIVGAVAEGGIEAQVQVPPWVMVIGALGIAAGLALFGPKLVRTVGEKITKLDRMRAFAVALGAAITVIVASALGLPVSSTHIAIGAVFGVGFFREFLANRRRAALAQPLDPLAERMIFEGSMSGNSPQAQGSAGSGDDPAGPMPGLSKQELKALKKARKRRLVRRQHLITIVAAWIVTVPAAAFLGAIFFFMIRGMLLP